MNPKPAPGGPGPIEVWWAAPGDAPPGASALLARDELERLDRYRRPEPARRYLAGRALLRLALGRRLGLPPAEVPLDSTCPDCGGPHGRPRLPAAFGPLTASVSHAGDRIGVAVGDGPLGLDVVEPDPGLDLSPDGGLLGRALAPVEAESLLALPRSARPGAFATVWARKEAVLKALGLGLSLPPWRLVVAPADEPAEIRSVPPQLEASTGQLTLRDLPEAHPGEGSARALAHRARPPGAPLPGALPRDGAALLAAVDRTNPASPPQATHRAPGLHPSDVDSPQDAPIGC
ncbi:4'-phosphopantetheinyl transferase family protein [Streptomyces triticirhizae]|uniref:4'-phosphopantetheinyl transferase superfamily protein n=1 Tax=Streptomyces triticirhizae TaxID=2483353 RepID=A0A3M2L2M7_9ACTN|nr:4'-phosphopantetheinyl transferase superfamily protein [Streptomyces triticirhizae]RMI30783.1 4'-phosphopantetheinyl transferase superfamily protein [Streptomyces triticirhizae]